MIYPINDYKSFGSPVKLVTRNLGIHPAYGAVSEGIVFLVPIGNSRFMIDQRGRFYYNGAGETRYGYQGRVEYIGQDTVYYDWQGRIERIGDYIVHYDSYSGRPERIGDAVFMYDSYTGLPWRIGGVCFYYSYNYGTSRQEISKIDECCFYYQSGGKLEKVTYYGNLPGSPKDPWYNQYTQDNTVNIYYDYYGKITKIGSVSIY